MMIRSIHQLNSWDLRQEGAEMLNDELMREFFLQISRVWSLTDEDTDGGQTRGSSFISRSDCVSRASVCSVREYFDDEMRRRMQTSSD